MNNQTKNTRELEAIRYELLKLKDDRGVYVINELGVNNPQPLHALIDYINNLKKGKDEQD